VSPGARAAERFRSAVEARDAAAAAATLAPSVVLHSPVLHEPFQGQETVARVLELVPQTIEDLHYIRQLYDGPNAALVFAGRLQEVDVQGVDLLHEDGEGQIDELMIMMRPLTAVRAFARAMGQRAAQEGLLPEAEARR
jgi:hypothetical protein